MSFFIDVVRSYFLRRELIEYQQCRETSIQISKEEDADQRSITNSSKLLCKFRGLKKKIKDSTLIKWCKSLKEQGKFTNYIITSIVGFICGSLLTIILMAALVLQAHMGVTRATVICSLAAPFFTLGLAFSTRFRCATLLITPSLASKRGRSALVAVAYIMAINGSVTNTMLNIGEMTESLACAQEQSRAALGKMAEAAKQPLVTARKAVESAMTAVKGAMKKIEGTVRAVTRTVASILDVIKSASMWLSGVVNICNRKLGTPFERCWNVFQDAAVDCKANLGPLFSWLCSVVYVAGLLCHLLHMVGLLCQIFHMITDSLTASVTRMASRFKVYVRNALYVHVDVQHSFDMDTNRSKPLTDIGREIREELQQKVGRVFEVFNTLGGLMSVTWILIFIKAWRYHHKFLVADRFDNTYITSEVKSIDWTRAQRGLECVLPLRLEERSRFCRPNQLRILPKERTQLAASLLFLFMNSVVILLMIMIDQGLFWLLSCLSSESSFLTAIPPMTSPELTVEGEGMVPDMFRNISKSMIPDDPAEALGSTEATPLDPSACLPHPKEPDMDIINSIEFILAMACLMAFVEPIVLRMRAVIMSIYYPIRAKERAVWLVGHILRERGGALRTITRLMGKRASLGGTPQEPLNMASMLDRLRDRSAVWRLLLGGGTRDACVECATVETEAAPLLQCGSLGCMAKFCPVCFSAQENLCSVCGLNLEQVEIEGLELECDFSSDEDSDSSRVDTERMNTELLDLEGGSHVTSPFDSQEMIQNIQTPLTSRSDHQQEKLHGMMEEEKEREEEKEEERVMRRSDHRTSTVSGVPRLGNQLWRQAMRSILPLNPMYRDYTALNSLQTDEDDSSDSDSSSGNIDSDDSDDYYSPLTRSPDSH